MSEKWDNSHSQPLRTFWDWHPDKCPNDYGPPDRQYAKVGQVLDEEGTWEEWERLKEADIETDIIY